LKCKYYRIKDLGKTKFHFAELALTLTLDPELPEHEQVINFVTIIHTFKDNNGCFAIGKQKGEVCGIAYIKDAAKGKNGVARIEHLYVDPEMRNQNIGSAFLKNIVNDFDKKSGLTVACEQKLIRFCKKSGFMNPIKSSDGSRYYALHTKRVSCKVEDARFHTAKLNPEMYDTCLMMFNECKNKYTQQCMA